MHRLFCVCGVCLVSVTATCQVAPGSARLHSRRTVHLLDKDHPKQNWTPLIIHSLLPGYTTMATQALLAQLRPAYGMRASPTVMKEIMREVLTEALAGQTYQVKFRVALLIYFGSRETRFNNRRKVLPITLKTGSKVRS